MSSSSLSSDESTVAVPGVGESRGLVPTGDALPLPALVYERWRKEGSFPRAFADNCCMVDIKGLLISSFPAMEDVGVVAPPLTRLSLVRILDVSIADASSSSEDVATLGAGGLSSRSPNSHAARRAFHSSGPVVPA
jgi:hypothetical protein